MATRIAAQFPILHMPSAQTDGWQDRVARFDSRQTIDVLTGGTGVLTQDQVMLLEEARRAFAVEAQRKFYVRDNWYADLRQRVRSAKPARVAEPPQAEARSRRQQITDAATETLKRVVTRAYAAERLKLRVAYNIPLHEWQDALGRAGGVEVLIAAYAPDAACTLPARIAPRCPPWATRKYRGPVQSKVADHG